MMVIAASLLSLVPSAAPAFADRTPHATITMQSLLTELTDCTSLARWPDPAFTSHEASSYDRAKIAPDRPGWYANSDQNQFIRIETVAGRKEKVMLDTDGPGCIVRFWLTTDRNKKGVLRIYLDNSDSPTISFPAYDLLSGALNIKAPLDQAHPGYRPDGNGGNTLYLPIPYARHCKVTWEEFGESSRYYQINYRSYDGDTRVRTFRMEDLAANRAGIERVNRLLANPPSKVAGKISQIDRTVAANSETSLTLPTGPAAVRLIELKLPVKGLTDRERTLRSLIVKMVCDGETTLWCPSTDFFGSGVGVNRVQNWYTDVTPEGEMHCRWVMPYHSSALVSLLNLSSQAIPVKLQATTTPWIWDDRSMHFHAVWHYESGLNTEPPREWSFVQIHGRGVYVGDVLALYNPLDTWYGEGDEKIWIDGEHFPSHLGTGTEDYYSFSYAPQPAHQFPFSGEPRIDQPMTQGHNTLIRTRSLDAIPFRSKLSFDFELISWKPMALTYAATTFWYAVPGAETSVSPQPRDASLPVPTLADAVAAAAPKRRAGAVECETMQIVSRNGDFFLGEQDMSSFGEPAWSNNKHLLCKANRVGDSFEIEWRVTETTPKRLTLYATQAPDFGVLQFSVNGKRVEGTFDGYSPKVKLGPAFDLGIFEPVQGKYRLKVEVAGANALSTGARYFLGLDCVVAGAP